MQTSTIILLLAGLLLVQAGLILLLRNWLRKVFDSLASQALIQNNRAFVDLAKATLEKFQTQAQGELALKQQAIGELVNPLKGTLEKCEQQMGELERKREQAYGGIRQYLESVTASQSELRRETGNLAKALQASHVRGRWGEMSLRRVVELAGLVEHCDFKIQESITTQDSRLRPDLIVYLPDQRRIVIDAKVPLDSYLRAVEATDGQKEEQFMSDHSKQLQRHITSLGSKSYWDHLEGSPEFVILYIPLESLYSAALRRNPELLEESIQKRVVLATPTTLIALLKAVDYGWKQKKLTQNAEEISSLGKELYDRLTKLADHLSRLGLNLDRAVQAYNDTAGSFERRVFVQARRFKDLGIPARNEIDEIDWIERTPRPLQQDEVGAGMEQEEVSLHS